MSGRFNPGILILILAALHVCSACVADREPPVSETAVRDLEQALATEDWRECSRVRALDGYPRGQHIYVHILAANCVYESWPQKETRSTHFELTYTSSLYGEWEVDRHSVVTLTEAVRNKRTDGPAFDWLPREVDRSLSALAFLPMATLVLMVLAWAVERGLASRRQPDRDAQETGAPRSPEKQPGMRVQLVVVSIYAAYMVWLALEAFELVRLQPGFFFIVGVSVLVVTAFVSRIARGLVAAVAALHVLSAPFVIFPFLENLALPIHEAANIGLFVVLNVTLPVYVVLYSIEYRDPWSFAAGSMAYLSKRPLIASLTMGQRGLLGICVTIAVVFYFSGPALLLVLALFVFPVLFAGYFLRRLGSGRHDPPPVVARRMRLRERLQRPATIRHHWTINTNEPRNPPGEE
jgi:hypothetical protein